MKHTLRLIALTCSLSLAWTACKKDLDPPPDAPSPDQPIDSDNESNRGNFNTAFQNAGSCGTMPDPINEPQSQGGPTEVTVVDGGYTYICQQDNVAYAPAGSEITMYTDDETMWIGNFFNGLGIASGSWPPLIFDGRNPYTVTINLNTGDAPASQVISDPSYSAYQAVVNGLQNNALPGSSPAYVTFEARRVRSSEEFKAFIRASGSGWGGSVATNVNSTTRYDRNYFAIRLVQRYYKLVVDLPAEADDWFGLNHLPNASQLIERCPVYVSSITYGRQIVMLVESSSSVETMDWAVSAAFSGFGFGFSFNAGSSEFSSLQDLSIRTWVYGGASSGIDGLQTGISGLDNLISSGAVFGPESPGVPIGFTLRRLGDNSVVDYVTMSEYTVQECQLAGEHVVAEPMTGTNYEWFCPLAQAGADDEFGDACTITGSVSLEIRNSNQVWALIHAEYNETGGDFSEGLIDSSLAANQVLLYEAPFGKHVSAILNNQVFYFNEVDNDHAPVTYSATSPFVHSYVINGDTDGDDIGECTFDNENSYLRVRFKPFDVTLTD